MIAEDINKTIRDSGFFVAKLRMDYGARRMRISPFPILIPTASVNVKVNGDLMEHVVMASISTDGTHLEIVSGVSNGVIVQSPGSKSRYPVEEVESVAIELHNSCKLCNPPPQENDGFVAGDGEDEP